MSISQKSINKGFALAVFGLYAFGFGATVCSKTFDYIRTIGDYKVTHFVDQSRVNSVQTPYQSVSHINGDDVTNYLSFDMNLTSNSMPLNNMSYYNKIDDSGNVVDSGTIASLVCDDTLSFLTATQNFDDDYLYFFRQKVGSVVTARLIVPASWEYIYNVEFSLTGNFNYGTFAGMNLFKDTNLNAQRFGLTNDNGNLNWFGFHKGYYQSNGLPVSSSRSGFDFYDYGFYFTTGTENYNFHFDFLGAYSNSNLSTTYYNAGYSDGFSDGQNSVLENPNDFNLYDYATYLAYGQSKYNEGVQAGANVLSLSGVMNTIFTAPINMFMQIFRSGAFVWTMPTGEVLDLGGLMTFFLTIGIALAIVRLIMKVGGK